MFQYSYQQIQIKSVLADFKYCDKKKLYTFESKEQFKQHLKRGYTLAKLLRDGNIIIDNNTIPRSVQLRPSQSLITDSISRFQWCNIRACRGQI